MHEISIAAGLIEQVIETARENNMPKVDEVEIETGELRQVIPEIMQEAFNAVIKETIAENAILKIMEIKAEARCNICQKVFTPEINDFLCPSCQKADVSILKGDDIILRAVACNI